MSELDADGVPVAVTCRVLKLTQQPYSRWLTVPVTAREVGEAYSVFGKKQAENGKTAGALAHDDLVRRRSAPTRRGAR